MRRETFSFLSTNRESRLHGVRWLPEDGTCRGVVQIAHGMTEFIERYEEFAGYLTDLGFVVVGHDHMGHGQSVIIPEEWGYFTKDCASDCLVWDMHRLRRKMENAYPGAPYIMLGHSMGSFLLRKYITRYGEGLAGAVIMGTGSVPDGVVKSAMAMIQSMAAVKGWRYRSKSIERMIFSNVFRRFNMDGTDPENSWLSKDVEKVKEYYADERCTFHFTLNGFYTLLETIAYDNQLAYMEQIPEYLPILLVSGGEDPIGNYGKGVEKVSRQLEKAGLLDISLRIFEDDRHEILNETDRQQVYAEIGEWCCEVSDEWQEAMGEEAAEDDTTGDETMEDDDAGDDI